MSGEGNGGYTPIACHLHDEFESAIVRRQSLEVEILQHGNWARQTIRPVDTRTANSEEYLRYLDRQGEQLEVRMDHIRLVR